MSSHRFSGCLALASRVHNDFGKESQNEVFDETDGKLEARPVMSVLQDLETVAIEVHIPIEVHFVECLHRDLALSMVFGLVGGVLEGQVMLDGATRILDLLVLSRAHNRRGYPETTEDGNRGKQGEEDGSLETTTNLPREPQRDTSDQRQQQYCGEAVTAGSIGGERGIFDSW